MKKGILLLVVLTTVFMTVKTVGAFGSENETTREKMKIEDYRSCIDACDECVIACDACINHCSASKKNKMKECGRLSKDCKESCEKTSKLMSYNSKDVKDGWLETMKIAKECAEECERFKSKECKTCAKACRKVVKECGKLLVD